MLRDLKKQEVQLLEASNKGAVEEKEAVQAAGIWLSTEMVGGPAFHKAGLDEADCYDIEDFVDECMTEFRKKYSFVDESGF